jgi:hypothetical protein
MHLREDALLQWCLSTDRRSCVGWGDTAHLALERADADRNLAEESKA